MPVLGVQGKSHERKQLGGSVISPLLGVSGPRTHGKRMIGARNLERRFRLGLLAGIALWLVPLSHPAADASSFSPIANVLFGKISQ